MNPIADDSTTSAVEVTQEAGGHVATCTCGWLRWEVSRSALDNYATAHLRDRHKTRDEG